MRIAICDSSAANIEKVIRQLKQIRELCYATIVSYIDPEWLISDVLQRTEAFDIAIIKRELGFHNGVYIAKRLLTKDEHCQIIFITDENRIYPEYYEIKHICVMPLELLSLHLVTAINTAIANIQNLNPQYLFVSANSQKCIIPCDQVLYMERVQRKTRIYLSNEVIETYQPWQEIIKDETAASFLQCHRSIVVNLRKVARYRHDELTLFNSVKIPIGRQYALQTKEAFMMLSNQLLHN